jgi:cell division protein FtsB
MNKPENIYYYGLGSNWAFTKLENLEEGYRIGGYAYIVVHVDYGKNHEVFYPVNEKGEKIPFIVDEIRCSMIERNRRYRDYYLNADIQDEKGSMKKCLIKGNQYQGRIQNRQLIELKEMMSELAEFGTWEAKEEAEERLKKEEEIKKMQQENERLKKENASLQQEINDLKAKLNH